MHNSSNRRFACWAILRCTHLPEDIMKGYRILAINPGSTSTKIAVFDDNEKIYLENVKHDTSTSIEADDFDEQVRLRKDLIEQKLADAGIAMQSISAYAGRGGGIVPCPGGTYPVTPKMMEDIRKNRLKHPAKYGAFLAWGFGQAHGKPAYIVNSPHTDELEEVARITGLAGIYKLGHVHALNQKEVAIRAAAELGKKYTEANFVVAHLGGGISITAHKKGRMVDTTDCIYGDGPMSPNRCGQMDMLTVVDMCYSGEYTHAEMRDLAMRTGGLLHHLGTSDGLEIEAMVREGDPYATLVFDAMLHQMAKWIGAMAAVLEGDVDAVLLTGGLVHDEYARTTLERKTSYIAPVRCYPGEFEMEALASGALRVLTNQEPAQTYTGKPTWPGLSANAYRTQHTQAATAKA